jgi:hypothetical protein
MTRAIRLPLAEDTTVVYCGSCQGLDPYESTCEVFAEELIASDTDRILRHPECTDAEREQAAIERDARFGRAVRLAIGHRNVEALAEKDVTWLVGAIAAELRGEVGDG